MKPGIKIKQHDLTDCGAACLASVAAYFGLRYPLSRIRQQASTNRQGTTLLGLTEAAGKMGLKSQAVRGTAENIDHIPVPSVAHIKTRTGYHHFVVIYKVTRNFLKVMDPATGDLVRISREEFTGTWTGILVLINPGEKFSKGNHHISTGTRFIQMLRPHRNVLLQAITGAVLYSLLGLSTSIYVQKIIDHVLADNNLVLLRLMSLAMVVILLSRLLIGIFKSLFVLRTGQKIDASMILGYFRHLLRLPQQVFDNMRTGELISRLNDAVKIRMFINDLAFSLLLNCLILILCLVIITVISWKISLLLLTIIPVYALIYLLADRQNRKNLRKIMEHSADLESHLVESINQTRTVKQLNLQDHSYNGTEYRFMNMLGSVYRAGRTMIITDETVMVLSGILTIVLLSAGSGLVLDRNLTPGQLMSLYTLSGYMMQPLNQLLRANKSIRDAMIAADRLFQVIDLETESGHALGMSLKKEMLGDIEFKDACFRYGAGKYIIKDFTCTIPVGSFTSLAGKSGCGKSTLVSLLQGIYPLSNGSIRIRKTNIKRFTPESIRQHIVAVPQKTELFTGSILDNICSFSSKPDMMRFQQVSDELNLDRLFEQLPEGHDTMIREQGSNLSGGEKQLIALARALYLQPDFLILDEATSSMDPQSEQQALKAVKDYHRDGHTVILISHKISNHTRADHIIVLDQGQISAIGSHQELIRAGGLYEELWRTTHSY